MADAIYSITPIGIEGSVSIAAKVLLFSHHPIVVNNSKTSWIWGKVKSHHEDIIEVLGCEYGHGAVHSLCCLSSKNSLHLMELLFQGVQTKHARLFVDQMGWVVTMRTK